MWTNVDVIPEDASVDHRILLDDRVIADDCIGANNRAGLDLHVAAELTGGDYLCKGRDFAALTYRDSVDSISRNMDPSLAVEDFVLGFAVLVEIADITPIVPHDVAEEGLIIFQDLREYVLAPVVGDTALHVVEDAWVQDVRPSVDRIREDFGPGGFFQEPLYSAVIVGDDDAEVERIIYVGEHN